MARGSRTIALEFSVAVAFTFTAACTKGKSKGAEGDEDAAGAADTGSVVAAGGQPIGGTAGAVLPAGQVAGASPPTNNGVATSIVGSRAAPDVASELGLTATCTTGQTIKYNGTTWECASDDVTVNADALVSGTVAAARLAPNVSLLGASIESSEISDGTIALADLGANSCASGSS